MTSLLDEWETIAKVLAVGRAGEECVRMHIHEYITRSVGCEPYCIGMIDAASEGACPRTRKGRNFAAEQENSPSFVISVTGYRNY